MKPIWQRFLWCFVVLLFTSAGTWSYSSWRIQQRLAELERLGIKLIRISDDTILLENHTNNGMTVADIKCLRPNERFTIADLANADISDSVVKALIETGEGPLTLRLNETQVTDAAFDLSTFNRWVSHLDLSRTQLTNAVLPRLHRFKQYQLGYLSLAQTNLGDAIFESFSEPINGHEGYGPAVVNLANTHITDHGLKAIRYSPHGLVLKDTAITDAGLAAMKFEELVYLDLTNTGITDTGLSALSELKRL